ncbi:MAG TPA: DNA-processing protein DprA [Pseudomonadota bacterium]|nr:DNA-processing protein DprA [Pseudomonadota bacterium]
MPPVREVFPGQLGCPARLLTWRKLSAVWLRGQADLLDGRPVCVVVGSRACSQVAEDRAFSLARKLAENGVVVMSGGALGVDAAAHRGALSVGGLTCAVLGTGIDVLYPSQNRPLLEEIAKRGLLLSTFPPGSPPKRGHFPRRNESMTLLADSVVLVEAQARSGSLITARHARKHGRRICGFSGSLGVACLAQEGVPAFHSVDDVADWVLSGNSAGCACAENESDEMPTPYRKGQDCGPAFSASHEREKGAADETCFVSETAHRVFDVLKNCKSADVGELCARTGLNAAECAAALVDLELAERCTRLAGGRYIVHAPLS